MQKIPFLRIAIALAVGIIAAHFNVVGGTVVIGIAIVVTASLFLINMNYNYRSSLFFGASVNLVFILLGIFTYQQFNKKPVFFEKGKFLGVVLEVPQEKENSFKSLIKIVAFNRADTFSVTNEKIVVYFEKSNNPAQLKPGQTILFDQTPQMIRNNGNPYEFDFKRYLGLKKIYRQVYLRENSWQITRQTAHSLQTRAEVYREKLLKIYRSQPIDKTELEILSALTLGYKRDLDPETKRVFSSSGAMHILAVSGLHVGVVWWLIILLFGFLKKHKTGRIVFVFGAILILWGYAFITGLSPSVMRATAMFTIFILGDNLNRKTNVYNSLAASAFFLLLFNPNNLFDMGFQLSYCAVSGIVFLQPKLAGLIKVKNKVVRYFWDLLTVSVAAQVATFPLSVFYFGQLPTYFWATNAVVIPSVMILIPEGIALLLFSKIPFLSTIISFTLNLLLKFVYVFLEFIERLPGSVVPLHINSSQLLLLAAILFSIFVFLENHRHFYLKAALVFILTFSISGLSDKAKQMKKNEIIVYNNDEFPVVHLYNGKTNYVVSEQKIADEAFIHRAVTETNQKRKLKHPVFLTLKDTVSNRIILKSGLIFFEGKTIVLNQSSHQTTKKITFDYLINPGNLNNNFHFPEQATLIVTNRRFAHKNDSNFIKIHRTYMNGAFVENW